MTRVLGFGVCSLSLSEKSYRKLHHDKGWQKKEAEKHVEKKNEKKNTEKKPRRNPAKSVHVCVCGKEGGRSRGKLLQKGAEICASGR